MGTYLPQPIDGHRDMTIGLKQYRHRREIWLGRMLLQPFRRSRNVESDPEI